jgi:hypothetical protein
LLLFAVLAALLLRLWNLDQLPPGLYRDEAYNGLDALKVLDGQFSLIFPANNGREPLYIYLTAAAVSVLGPTTMAVRVSAAIIGGLATIPVFLLGRSWFGWTAGIAAAWLWAITLWSVHLSRLGLRPILFVPLIALAFWVGTLAYRRQQAWLWLISGMIYGLTFYTYLVARFTPVLLLALALYLLATRRGRLWPGVLWFSGGSIMVLLPLLAAFMGDPALVLGRTGQVSILNPVVNEGSVFSTLVQQTWAALGMYVWRGDDILRHNPAGRPVFDWIMAVPFLVGTLWCLKEWRRPPAAAVLLWSTIMLGPTILAADTPHFLRAVGVLPAIIYLPALGLRQLARRLRLPAVGGAMIVALLLGASLLLTIRDYVTYGRDPAVGYAFERAASDLAGQINHEPAATDVRLDERFWSSWPSISYLVSDAARVTRFDAAQPFAPLTVPATVYAWLYDSMAYIAGALPPAALIKVDDGSLARGDLEETAYPLYVRYGVVDDTAVNSQRQAGFAGQLFLRQVELLPVQPDQLQVDVYWDADPPVAENLIAFVHVSGPDGLVGQDDGPPAGGRWPASWWQPGLVLRDRRVVTLDEAYDPARHAVTIGLYDAQSGERLPVTDMQSGDLVGDVWAVANE